MPFQKHRLLTGSLLPSSTRPPHACQLGPFRRWIDVKRGSFCRPCSPLARHRCLRSYQPRHHCYQTSLLRHGIGTGLCRLDFTLPCAFAWTSHKKLCDLLRNWKVRCCRRRSANDDTSSIVSCSEPPLGEWQFAIVIRHGRPAGTRSQDSSLMALSSPSPSLGMCKFQPWHSPCFVPVECEQMTIMPMSGKSTSLSIVIGETP
jgi:hypothetical protein